MFNRLTYNKRKIGTQGREGVNARAHKRGESRAVGKEAAESADAQRGGRREAGRSAPTEAAERQRRPPRGAYADTRRRACASAERGAKCRAIGGERTHDARRGRAITRRPTHKPRWRAERTAAGGGGEAVSEARSTALGGVQGLASLAGNSGRNTQKKTPRPPPIREAQRGAA